MLPDLSLSNLFLENLGATFENLLHLTNLVIYHRDGLLWEKLSLILSLLHIWPSQAQMTEAMNTVLFIFYSNNNYFETLSQVYEVMPYFYVLDYLHLFYVKQIMYKTYIELYTNSSLASIKPLTINLHLDIIFSYFTNKWGYTVVMFGLVYYLSNVMKFRYQYGTNFYFTYFKTVADLAEQEYGSYDDYKFFLFLLVQILAWYCWVFFIGYTFFLCSQSTLLLMTVSIMVTILTIPVRMLWDFGLAFGMYVRGAASSSNLIAEAFFDIIGVIIIFTRFVVQNIRFLLVFVAFFELFEWTFSANTVAYTLQFNLDVCSNLDLFTNFGAESVYVFIISWLKVVFVYLYHLLHLIIVSFMQIGVYLMVSFWLFFFLYTSFFKLTTDSYFAVKRN